MNSPEQPHDKRLIKFLIASSACFFVGTVHGVLQVIRPIRAWLDSIGSPYGGPGHMIDPLAHAHINVVGGVVIFVMGASYYLLPRLTGTRIHSKSLIEHTFWWTTLGIVGFYSTLMTFGILEGRAMLANPGDTATAIETIHHYYGPIISIVSSVMGVGFWLYFFNLYKTARRAFRKK